VLSATLEIHVLNVGQGDAVLVVNRDLDAAKNAIAAAKGAAKVPSNPIDYIPYAVKNGIRLTGTVRKALLVDGGDDGYGGNVVDYLTTFGVIDERRLLQPDLALVVSHYHDDHIAGLRSVFKQRIDPKAPGQRATLADRFRPGIVYQSLPGRKTNPPSQRFADFQRDLTAAVTAAVDRTEYVDVYPGGLTGVYRGEDDPTIKIGLGAGVNGYPITVHVLASGQAVWNAAARQVVPIKSVGSAVDQNDRSIVLMLEYGSFRCLLGGDIAGNGGAGGGNFGGNAIGPGEKRYFSVHADVESVLGPALEAYFPQTPDGEWLAGKPKFTAPGYATVFKANHHGSSSSVDVHLLATLAPLVFVGSSGVKARFHAHPTQQVMNRIDATQTPQWGRRASGPVKADKVQEPNTIKGAYLTEVAAKVKGKSFTVDTRAAKIMGTTVVRPVDETIAQIQQATAKGQQLSVQVYGAGILTALADPRSSLRPTAPVSADGIYPIGPFTHFDLH